MIKKIKILFFFLLFLSPNLALSKISISVDSWSELIGSLDELKVQVESVRSNDSHYANTEKKEVPLGFFDNHLKRFENKLDGVKTFWVANKKFLKLSGFVGAFIYVNYINTHFLPNLVEMGAITVMKYMSIFMDSLFKGALVGAWENKGVTTKVVGGVILYSIVNNVFSIGIKSLAEYYIEGRKREAVNEVNKQYGILGK